MKTYFLILVLLLVVSTTATYSQSRSESCDTTSSSWVQWGMETGIVAGPETFGHVGFNFSTAHKGGFGVLFVPTVGLEGWRRHQILGSLHYYWLLGLSYGPVANNRSALLGGYLWGGRYDGIQIRDPQNRRYRGWWYGFRVNFPDGVFVPHGNFSLTGKVMPITVQDLPTRSEFKATYFMFTLAYTCDFP